MGLLRDILRQYWAKLLAIGVFACAAVKYCLLNDAFDLNRHLAMVVLAFGGLVAFIANDEWSDWIGYYSVIHLQWLTMPPWFIRLIGCIVLVFFTVALYCL
ncbi:MAG: hypothetical protein ACLP9L_05475 [Thermoguttaceae bacterium]